MGEVRQFATRIRVAAAIGWALTGPALAAATPPGTRIVNVAHAHALVPADGGPTAVALSSNPVVTVVAPLFGLDLTLAVAPDTTVAPGTGLVLRLDYRSVATADLNRCRVRLPLDRLLPAPTSFTGSPAQQESALAAAAYDGIAHEVAWLLQPVPPGGAGTLEVRVQVPADAPEDALISHQGLARADELAGEVPSNRVDVHVLAPALTLTKQADREAAEVGDTVGYLLTVGNVSQATTLAPVSVRDLLPPGLRFVEGSARLEGRPAPDPVIGGDGRALSFSLPALAPGSAQALRYRARIAPGAERGDGVNVATAEASSPGGAALGAGPARAGIRIEGGLFSGESVVAGRVFIDDDGDGRPGPGEPGVPWVRLLLEDGTFAITDIVGKYHLEGIRRGLHVLRLDGQTLPEALAPRARGVRAGRDDDALFVDLAPDELYKANFPVAPAEGRVPRLAIRVDGEARPWLVVPAAAFGGPGGPHPALAPRSEDLARYLEDLGRAFRSLRVEPLDGAVPEVAAAVERELRRELRLPAADGPDASTVAGAPAPTSEEDRVRAMPRTLAILSPADGARVRHTAGEVEVRVPLPSVPRLSVNGEAVPASQIAQRMVWERGGIGVYKYLNVPFREGSNEIRLRAADGERESEEEAVVRVHRPGAPAAIRVEAPPTPADGTTEPLVRLVVVDAAGHAVAEETLLTVEVDAGGLHGLDADPSRDGFQVRVEDGVGTVRLPPSGVAAERRLKAVAGLARGEGVAAYVAAAGPWVVVGAGEARFGSDAVAGLQEIDGDLIGDDEDPAADGRLALFARGSVANDHVLTFAYDSERSRDPDHLFREIDPDRFFPAYGDSSAQGYAAETSGKLFARWEHSGSSALVGDFSTGLTGGELARYDRRLSGVKTEIVAGRFGVQAFGAETSRTLVRDEIPGAGISGPYALTRRPITVNSEVVSVEVRDRFHTERVLSVERKLRHLDYDVDYYEGTLLFKEPIPAADAAFNPVTVVVLYESDDSGDRHRLAGGRARVRLPGRGEAGATYVQEGHEAGDATLAGIDVRFDPLPGLTIAAEGAQSDDPLAGSAGALRFEAIGHVGARAVIRGYFRDVDAAFTNPSGLATTEAGTRKYGVEAQADLAARTRLRAEAFSQEDRRSGAHRDVAGADLERDFGRYVLGGGYRYTASSGVGTPDVAAHMLRAGARVRFTPVLEGILERDQTLGGQNVPGYPTRTRGGVDYRLPDGSRLFLRQEIEEGDGPTANRTLAGVESQLGDHTTVTGKYTLEDAFTGRANRANLGLRTTMPIGPLWNAQFFGERVATISGDDAGDFTSAGGGFEYLPERLKLSGRYEVRFGETDTRHLLTAAGAVKLGPDYSLFVRQRWFLTDPDGGANAQDSDLLAGVAYRPLDRDRWNWLARLDLGGDGGGSPAGTPRRSLAALAFEANVEPAARWQITGKVAGRWVAEDVEEGEVRTLTGLVQIRVGRDIGERWNVGGAARLLAQPSSGTAETGFGVEAGFLVIKDLWLVGGYNVTGFDDGTFRDADRTEQGPYLAIRFKFDESTFAALGN